MPFGKPRSESERIAIHKAIYGEDSEPPEKRQGKGIIMNLWEEMLSRKKLKKDVV